MIYDQLLKAAQNQRQHIEVATLQASPYCLNDRYDDSLDRHDMHTLSSGLTDLLLDPVKGPAIKRLIEQ